MAGAGTASSPWAVCTRPLPAGPLTPMEGPQSQGLATARFAVHVGERDPYAVVDDAFLPLVVTRGGGEAASGDARYAQGERWDALEPLRARLAAALAER